MFNPNIGKLDHKKVSYHFVGYPDKSKVYHFYCPHRHTKFVKMRHTTFLEDEMVWGSMAAREINLEENRVHVPTPNDSGTIFFSTPVAAVPTVQGTMVTAPVVCSLVATTIENEEPVLQEPIEIVVTH